MKINLGSGLIPVNVLTFLLVALISFFPSDVTRIFIGIPFLLFFPGYTLTIAFFVINWRLSAMERVALSVGLSIVLIALIGMILNYTPWGIGLESVMYSVASVIVIFSVVAWYRRQNIHQFERFNISFHLTIPSWSGNFWDKATNLVIIVAILGIVGLLGYVIAVPKTGEIFTEFYILDSEGQTGNYPRELNLGEETAVILGIINQEDEDTTYMIEMTIGDRRYMDVGPITLEDGQKWESEVILSPEVVGEDQKVQFLLYMNDATEPHLESHFWIDVYPSA